jgi:hypothetical protein
MAAFCIKTEFSKQAAIDVHRFMHPNGTWSPSIQIRGRETGDRKVLHERTYYRHFTICQIAAAATTGPPLTYRNKNDDVSRSIVLAFLIQSGS